MLRPHVTVAGWWVLASVVAVAVVGAMVFAVAAVNVDVGWVLGVALLGTVLGVLQWLLLRGQFSRAGWWVLASSVGWVFGLPVVGILGAAMSASWAVIGAVYGTITGPVLVWLVRQ